MSSSICLIPIIAALLSAETTFIGGNQWHPTNNLQANFISSYLSYKTDINNLFASEELKTRTSPDVNVINEFLRTNNFDIQLRQSPAPAMYVASIMNIMVNWSEKGIAGEIECNDITYPALSMNSSKNSYECFTLKNHPEPIIALKTQSGDMVYVTAADQKRSDFNLLSYLMTLSTDLKNNNTKPEYFTDILFPMVEINEQPDITWLIDMYNNGWAISQALQQTKFQMNEEGAAAQSACALEICGCSSNPQLIEKKLIIDKPFFLWIVRKGLELPIFAAYCNTDTWKKPQQLKK